MIKILNVLLWTPAKFLLSFFPQSISIFLKRRIINFLSYFGYSNSQNRMDKAIIEFFDFKKNGICLEVGAADGIDQSNSLHLERIYQWKVFLVEPTKTQYEQCKIFRTNASIDNVAFVSEETYKQNKTIGIEYDALMSSIKTNDFNSKKYNKSLQLVQTITLDKFFLKNNITTIDILILDVEGYEIEVLEGYKRSFNTIKYLLVEAWNFNKFNEYAEARGWEFIKKIGNDYLYNLSN